MSIIAEKSIKALNFALGATLLNQFILEPTSSSIMAKRFRLENDGREDSDEYKKLTSSVGTMSFLLNLIALGAGVAHGINLASALVF